MGWYAGPAGEGFLSTGAAAYHSLLVIMLSYNGLVLEYRTTYHESSETKYGYNAVNTENYYVVDCGSTALVHTGSRGCLEGLSARSLPETVPEPAVLSISLRCLETAVACKTPCL